MNWQISSETVSIVDISSNSWRDRARCRGKDTDWFYPKRGASTVDVKEFCNKCEVRNECFTFAIFKIEKFGIWGGTSERERRKYRKELSVQGYKFEYQENNEVV